jgi:ATP-binding protein involved in chromosome partitioning
MYPAFIRSFLLALTEELISQALTQVKFPGLPRDIVALGFVDSIEVQDGVVTIRLSIPAGNPQAIEQMAKDAHAAASALSGVTEVNLEVMAPQPKGVAQPGAGPPLSTSSQLPTAGPPPPPPGASHDGKPLGSGGQPEPLIQRDPIPGVRHVVAVASGKGGVGKSTVAVNIAAALNELGNKVGLMDADIYGPSIPTMLGIHEEPEVVEVDGEKKLGTIEKFGINLMSLGFLQEQDAPVIWRGPLVMRAVRQFLRDVDWRGSEILVIDLPPGTGDAQLTLTQSAPLDGAVIVTTPQDVALIDARKGLHMFREVGVPVIGIVENMSMFRCPDCGHVAHIFRTGGGERTAKELGVPFLGSVPIDPLIAESGDLGVPIVVSHPDSEVAGAFREIAVKIAEGFDSDTKAD